MVAEVRMGGGRGGVGCGGSCSTEQRKAHQDVSFIAGWYLKASSPTHRDERRGALRADESCEGRNDEAGFFFTRSGRG